MRAQRARQTPEERQAQGRQARAAQQGDVEARLIARIRCVAETEDRRILAAFRAGLAAGKSGRWRQRRAQLAEASGR